MYFLLRSCFPLMGIFYSQRSSEKRSGTAFLPVPNDTMLLRPLPVKSDVLERRRRSNEHIGAPVDSISSRCTINHNSVARDVKNLAASGVCPGRTLVFASHIIVTSDTNSEVGFEISAQAATLASRLGAMPQRPGPAASRYRALALRLLLVSSASCLWNAASDFFTQAR